MYRRMPRILPCQSTMHVDPRILGSAVPRCVAHCQCQCTFPSALQPSFLLKRRKLRQDGSLGRVLGFASIQMHQQQLYLASQSLMTVLQAAVKIYIQAKLVNRRK